MNFIYDLHLVIPVYDSGRAAAVATDKLITNLKAALEGYGCVFSPPVATGSYNFVLAAVTCTSLETCYAAAVNILKAVVKSAVHIAMDKRSYDTFITKILHGSFQTLYVADNIQLIPSRRALLGLVDDREPVFRKLEVGIDFDEINQKLSKIKYFEQYVQFENYWLSLINTLKGSYVSREGLPDHLRQALSMRRGSGLTLLLFDQHFDHKTRYCQRWKLGEITAQKWLYDCNFIIKTKHGKRRNIYTLSKQAVAKLDFNPLNPLNVAVLYEKAGFKYQPGWRFDLPDIAASVPNNL